MEKLPFASIIVPLYNAQSLVEGAVRAVKSQTCDDWEAIFVDDGSTDQTLDRAAAAMGSDHRFKLIHQENAGPGSARNTAMAFAQGEYLMFFDHDDIPSCKLVETVKENAAATKADIIAFGSDHFDVLYNEKRPSPDAWDATLYPRVFDPADYASNLFNVFRNWPWDKAFKRSFIEENGIAFPDLYRTEDLAFTCSALAKASTIAPMSDILYTYRVNDKKSSTQTLDLAPTDFFESAKTLASFLRDHGLMDRYRQTYNSWVGLCIYVNLAGLNDTETFLSVYRLMRNGGIEELGLADIGEPSGFAARVKIAGDITEGDVARILRIIKDEDEATGIFEFGQLKCEIAQRHLEVVERDLSHTIKQLANELDAYSGSRAHRALSKVGGALSPIINRNAPKVKSQEK